MDTILRIGVIGAGVFGRYHLQKCYDHPRIELIGVFDPKIENVRYCADQFCTRGYQDRNRLIAASEAVIIAAPASFHGELALEAMRAGRHVLVEKPLASDLATGEALVREAKVQNRILQTGHQERFVIKAIGLDKVAEKPLSIKAKRMSLPSERGTDVSVTLDLMIHDLDLAIWLMGGEPDKITGQSVSVTHEQADTADAILHFGDREAHLIASRVAEKPERTLEITYPSGTVHIDFLKKSVTHNTDFDLDTDYGVKPAAQDALATAMDAFIGSVLDGQPVVIAGEDGLAAVRAAIMIDQNN